MKKQKEGFKTMKSKMAAQNLNTVSTICLILLMIIYLVVAIYGSGKLAEKANSISNHPFEVVIAANDLKLYISEMEIYMEQLVSHHGSEDIKAAKAVLEKLDQSLDEPISKMTALYLDDKGEIQSLEKAIAGLKKEQLAYLDFVSSGTAVREEAEKYEKTLLRPLYESTIEKIDKIIDTTQSKKVDYGKTVELLRKSMLIGSVITITLLIGGLILSQYVLRRQNKELLHRNKLFDNLSLSIDDTFIICNPDTGTVYYAALNMERVLGVPTGAKFYELNTPSGGFHVEDMKELKDILAEAKFESPYEKLVEYIRPTGEKNWMLVRLYRIESKDMPQCIVVISDRTNDVKAHRALQDAMMNAEKANVAKSDFLSRMSHEIRTPLNAIIGMTTIAAASVQDPAKVEDCLSKISFSSKHLLMLINDILDMSKIESNKMLLQNETFDIFQVINEFVATVYPQAKAKKIKFEESMEGFGEHAVFVGDPFRLNQILLNLSSNAIKFTPSGGKVCLKVSKLVSKRTVDMIRFTISDTGIGMSKEALDKIFVPFEQAEASIASRYGGSGLGMSITKNLVTLMNGRIEIKSEPNVGTTCIVDLPFEYGIETDTEPDFGNQQLKALIVDDEQQACEQTALMLEKIKIKAEWVLSGKEAVQRIEKSHENNEDFDFCLIDWKMPDMDGIELTRRIRACVGADIPIIMISSYDSSEIEQEARLAGANGFLPKPLYRTSVYAAIKTALEMNGRKAEQKQLNGEQNRIEGKRLLVAEDNELNREIIQELLEMNGIKVECAINGQEAWNLFVDSAPGYYDAILMDVQMPVMDGYEATRKIRSSAHPMAKKIPIIATTANAFSDDISMALASGMNSHVSKPLDIQRLCKVLLELLEKEETLSTHE